MRFTDQEMKPPKTKLLPHQAALLATFFSPESKRLLVLRGDVGLGKSTALMALATRMLSERPNARILFLVFGALGSQCVEKLRDEDTPSLLVDRYRFREMLDSTSGRELWPAGAVSVVGWDLARQADVRDALVKARWDLVIADQPDQFNKNLSDFLMRLGESSERIVLATLPNEPVPDGISEDDATFWRWSSDQIVGAEGQRLDQLPRPLLHEVHFNLSAAESNLWDLVNELARTVEASSLQQSWAARSLRNCLYSSPAVLERALQRLVRGLEATDAAEPLPDPSEEEELEGEPGVESDHVEGQNAAPVARRALEEIEKILGDSKLEAFGRLLAQLRKATVRSPKLLNQLRKVTVRPPRICVLTGYKATLFYVAAELESLRFGYRLLHGDMAVDERHLSLGLMTSSDEILVATRSATEGVNLRDVSDLILYDLPDDELALRGILGRFDRFLRTSQLNVHVFIPCKGTSVLISQPGELLRNILGSPADAQSR